MSPHACSRDNQDASTQITKSKRIVLHGLFTVLSQAFQTSIRCSVRVMTDEPGPSSTCTPCAPYLYGSQRRSSLYHRYDRVVMFLLASRTAGPKCQNLNASLQQAGSLPQPGEHDVQKGPRVLLRHMTKFGEGYEREAAVQGDEAPAVRLWNDPVVIAMHGQV